VQVAGAAVGLGSRGTGRKKGEGRRKGKRKREKEKEEKNRKKRERGREKEWGEKKGKDARAGGIHGGDRAAELAAVTAAGRPCARGACARNEEKMA
jgi:hypothetical protein